MTNGKPSQLARELKRIGSDYTRAEGTRIIRKLSIDAFRNLVMLSAVDTGFLRSNWHMDTGAPDESVLKNSLPSAKKTGGSPSLPGAKLSTFKSKLGDKITIFNNTEYARHLEDGTPHMRAQPMVRPTYYRVLSQAKQLTNALSRKRVN